MMLHGRGLFKELPMKELIAVDDFFALGHFATKPLLGITLKVWMQSWMQKQAAAELLCKNGGSIGIGNILTEGDKRARG